MKKSCFDDKMRTLLHAYELGMLSFEEKDLFEVHLLECEACFERLKQFAPRGLMLSTSPQIRQLLDEIHLKTDRPLSFWQRLLRILWPEGVPTVLRPAVLIAILLLTLYPAYLGIRGNQGRKVAVIQEIALMQIRSSETFRIHADQGVVLSFLCPEGGPGSIYSVSLSDQNGFNIYDEETYSDADSYGIGRLFLPGHLLSEGMYKMTVRAVGLSAKESIEAEYVFHISFADSLK